MKARQIIQFVFGLSLLALANGCATKALWQNDNLEAWNEPATNPNLHLFATQPRGDMLVVYNEYSERSDTTRTRAYWLNKNQKLVDARRAPHFVNPNSAFGLTALPIFTPAANQIDVPPPPYAILATNGQSFTLYSDNGQPASHDLPIYNDRKGKVEKVALTPLTTTADATIVGGFLGYLYLAGRCGASGPLWY